MMRPRWRKALADLWGNKVRSLLVVASVGIGLFAVGMLTTMHTILTEDIRASYAAVGPANIQINSAEFDDDLVDSVRRMRGVQAAEGVRVVNVMTRTGADEWQRITLFAIPDFSKMNINRVQVESGHWPPADHQVAIERNKAGELYMPSGVVEVKLPSGKIRKLRASGMVHDQTVGIASTGGGYFLAPIQGFITTGTLEMLEQPEDYNLLYVTVASGGDNPLHVRDIANQITRTFENNDVVVYNAITRGTHDHPNAAYVDAVAGVLFALGFLVVFLSTFLITNTLTALINQQGQQIAIMKMVGARSFQITWVYMALILSFGLLALLFSLPLSREAAFALLDFLSRALNFDVISYRTVLSAVVIQVGIALIVPQVAGIVPILRGTHQTVQEALSDALTESDPASGGWFDRWLAGLGRHGSRAWLTRVQLISLRNTFRHKGRLALTLITLTLGGAIFIATFNVQASLEEYIRKLGRYFMADVNLTLDAPYRISEIKEALKNVPGVGLVEGWGFARTELLLENDKVGDSVQLVAPPNDSLLIQPIMLQGRWTMPGDRNDIVLSERFLSSYPNLRVGDTLRLRVNGEKTTWRVVGFFQLAGKSAGFIAYTGYDYLSTLTHEPKRALSYRINANWPNLTTEEQRALGARIETYLQGRGFGVTEFNPGRSLIENSSGGLNTLTAFLLFMAILTAIVGSIGLAGTMSMNVLDRTREIGVMRAIGASDRAVMRLVIGEGVFIGLISWVLGTLLALPISKLLSDIIHLAVFDARSDFTFTLTAPLYWLGLVLLLAVLASVIPARMAARLTIREALAYE